MINAIKEVNDRLDSELTKLNENETILINEIERLKGELKYVQKIKGTIERVKAGE